jgi:hypothetical protein
MVPFLPQNAGKINIYIAYKQEKGQIPANEFQRPEFYPTDSAARGIDAETGNRLPIFTR